VRSVLFALVFLSPPFLKILLLRWFCTARIGHRAQIGWFSAVMGRGIELGERSVIRPFTLIHLNGKVKLGRYSEISSFNLVYGSSSLIVGDHSYIGPQSLINADEQVRLGCGSALGPRTQVFTHGSFLPYTEGYWVKLAGVTIGDKVWSAAGVFIHPGVEIGDNTFVNSRSVVAQNIPPGSVVQGNPAQVIYPMERLRRKMSPARVDAAIDKLLHDFAEIALRRELGIQTVKDTRHSLDFRWHGNEYLISLIPSTGTPPDTLRSVPGVRQILLVNRLGWSPPPGAMVLDMTGMRSASTSDPICVSLQRFMQRYYGIQIEINE
jgi:acetyltransferase-like isoleucine patch superfamily enzyme